MDKVDDKTLSNFDIFACCIDSINSNPELFSTDTVRNLMLISIARSLASIADKMNETK